MRWSPARVSVAGTMTMDREPIWVPEQEEAAAAEVSRFARWLTRNGRARLTGDYLELWRWSVDRLDEFWPAVWDYFGVRSATRYERVLSGSVMPDVEWFTGAQVSYVDHVFRGRDPERVAVIDAWESARPGEGPVSRPLTWGMLREQVGGVAAMLRELGVRPGDRVAGYVPNAAEAVIVFLATASLGAIWSGCGQDYSPAAAAERLGQLEPAVLIAADGYRYGGRAFDRRGSVSELAALLPTLRATIVFPRLGLPADTTAGRLGWPRQAGSRYREAYFGTYPGVWRHGDWITITDRWSVVVHGRSDATLNRHGIRMGSADIYHVVEQFDEIAEALVVGVEQPEGEYWMPLFVVLNPGHELDEALTGKIRQAIREQASPRHVPDEIIAAPAIPHTRTGKKLEIPVKRILQGGDPRQVMAAGAVDNPDALAWFAAYQARTPIP
jgi:acyl-coenzyme A synthetase/AMP-(fatty) acid ligase